MTADMTDARTNKDVALINAKKQFSAVSRKAKVKTGCITCRIRKVKCDEDKPSCKRCTSTGRKCDGYTLPVENALAKQSRLWFHIPLEGYAIIRARPDIADTGFASEEHRWLNFFRAHTAPALTGVFDDGFWTSMLPQIYHAEPAVRHATLALGSSHAYFQSKHFGTHPMSTAPSADRKFGLWQYNRAIAELQTRLRQGSESTQVALICCLLFICLECLYGNRSLVLDHLKNGLHILESMSGGNNNNRTGALLGKLHEIFNRLAAQSVLFGSSAHQDAGLEGIVEPALTRDIPKTFSDIHEAKSSLDVIVSSIFKFVNAAMSSNLNPYTLGLVQRCQLELYAKLLAWHRSFNQYREAISRSWTFKIDSEKREPLLRGQYTGTLIWLQACLSSTEMIYDSFKDEFAAIVTWTDSVTDTNSCMFALPNSPKMKCSSMFALDQGLIPALYLTAIKCRDPVIRRRAIASLEAIPGREGLWDTRLHARVARRIVGLEEDLTKTSNGQWLTEESFVPEHRRIRNASILEGQEGALAPNCQVTFYILPQGLQGEWKTWEETIYY